jgi:NAD+ diphosphatase
MTHRENAQFNPGIRPPQEQSEPAYWFLFQGARLIVLDPQPATPSAAQGGRGRREGSVSPGLVSVPFLADPAELNLVVVARQYLGHFRPGADEEIWQQADPVHCYSGEVGLDSRLPAPLISLDLRELWGRIDPALFALAGRAKQIVQWDRDHQFCGRCARPLVSLDYDRAKRCPSCDLTSYPRISPAIITAITRTVAGERQILLVRSPRFPPGMYSVIAGFVEPGESLEQCVEREVWEEVGLQVKQIRYFGSQPWPFPNSLMLGFTAEYAGGDLRLEEEEVVDARWFTLDNLPKVPPPISIARQLIDNFVAQSAQE